MKISDLRVEELKKSIADSVRANTGELIEDLVEANSPS